MQSRLVAPIGAVITPSADRSGAGGPRAVQDVTGVTDHAIG